MTVEALEMSGAAWYDIAFDDLYAEIYGHRDQAEAERIIAWLARRLAVRSAGALAGGAWVDLACGAGRHLEALTRRGVRAVGIDRSRPLLALAAARRASAELVLGDLRALPFAERSFVGAINMFTSLGYFEKDEENRAVLAEAARVIAPGGCFLVDYLNAEAITQAWVGTTTRAAGPYRVEEERHLDEERGRVVKEVAVFHASSGELAKRYRESVAFWSRSELESRLAAAGFLIRARAGDYDGRPFVGPRSPRLILLATRAG